MNGPIPLLARRSIVIQCEWDVKENGLNPLK